MRLPALALPLALPVVLAGTALAALPAGAQDTPYAIAAVPAPLLRGNPDAIVRLDETRFDLASPGRAQTTVRRAVTVLRASGREAAEAQLYYDRFRRVKSFSARLYDHSGRLVRRSERGDVQDYSAVSDGSLFDDARVRTLSLSAAVPYTVEIEYELEHDGVLGWPSWYPHEGYPVERSRFTMTAPEGLAVRTHTQGAIPAPVETTERGRRVRTWEVAALGAPALEAFGPPPSQQLPALHLAGSDFSIGGVDGTMQTWAAFGDFYAGMSRGRQVLPPAARADVAALVETSPDVRETVRRLYRYAQARTRYVSVQLGIGGWQPYDAAYVHGRSYGDCKALTNYLAALLDAAGVPAFPVLVTAGADAPDVRTDFPSNPFNHVVLAVPTPTDTLWLEATSQTLPPGHLGTFTEGRWGLFVRAGASHLVRIPRSAAAANRQERRVRIEGLGSPEVTASVALRVTGNQADRVRDRLLAATPQERETWLVGTASVPVARVLGASYDGIAAGRDTATVTARLKLSRFGTAAGSRTLLPLLLERWSHVPPALTGTRTQPIRYFPYAFEDVDTVEIALPPGARLEAVPAPVEIEAPFGRYALRAERGTDGVLVVTRRIVVSGDALEPGQYDALRAFLTRVAAADNQQAVIVR